MEIKKGFNESLIFYCIGLNCFVNKNITLNPSGAMKNIILIENCTGNTKPRIKPINAGAIATQDSILNVAKSDK